MDVNVKEVLSKLGIDVATERRNEIIIKCPFHDDRNPSASINKQKALFNCFVCGGMGIEKFIIKVSGKDKRFAKAILDQAGDNGIGLENFAGDIAKRVNGYRDEDLSEDDLEEMNLKYIDYMGQRQIPRRVALKWGIGYHRKTGRIIFPVRDHSGGLKGTIGRLAKGEGPRYVLIHFCHPSRYLFGEYMLQKTDTRIVVEGPFVAVRLQKFGLPAVAVMKSKLTGSQIARLKMVDNIYLGFDDDKAGRKGVLAALKDLPKAKIIIWPKDVDDLDKAQIIKSIRNAKTPIEVKKLWRQQSKKG